jgi:NADPH:quinone reductase-like Zn-dependent oxidoreductase
MRAIVQDGYGSPLDVLVLKDVEEPVIGEDGVLVRVRASSVNAQEWHQTRGFSRVARAILRMPSIKVPGSDVAGVVEAVGADVTELHPGDEVFGARMGAYAEYVAGRVRNFVPKPATLDFEQAAAIPVAAITALQALRDKGEVQAGQRVMILGAGGGVGHFAVQLAKAFGAEVTAVTSTSHLDMVRLLGPDEVIDYTREDVTRAGRRFDLILDVGGYRSLHDLSRAMAAGGTAVMVGAGKADLVRIGLNLGEAALRSRVRGQRMRSFLARVTRDDVLRLGDLAADGKLRPVIDRTYPLAQTAHAVAYVGTGQARGKVVITV